MAATIDTEELVIGDGWLIAHYPRVQCAYFGPNVDNASFEHYLERLAADIDARSATEKIGVFYYAPNSNMDSPRRRKMAKVLDDRKDKLAQSTAAYAMATSSPFVRGLLTTLFWLAPPGYPYKMVATPEQGLGFIAEQLAQIDTQIDAPTIAASFMQLLSAQMQQAS